MIKNIAVTLLAINMLACSTSKKIAETTAVETEKVVNKIGVDKNRYLQITRKITAKKDANGNLIGVANKDSFQDDSFKGWFNSRYIEYTADKEIVVELTNALKGYTIKGFMGTWCGDSKRETPRIYKILDETGFDQNNFELITVNRDKKTPDNLQEGLTDILQKNIKIGLNNKILREGKLLLFNVKDFYVHFLLETVKTPKKNYDIPVPFRVIKTKNELIFDYAIVNLTKRDPKYDLAINSLVKTVGKKSKFFNNTLTISF